MCAANASDRTQFPAASLGDSSAARRAGWSQGRQPADRSAFQTHRVRMANRSTVQVQIWQIAVIAGSISRQILLVFGYASERRGESRLSLLRGNSPSSLAIALSPVHPRCSKGRNRLPLKSRRDSFRSQPVDPHGAAGAELLHQRLPETRHHHNHNHRKQDQRQEIQIQGAGNLKHGIHGRSFRVLLRQPVTFQLILVLSAAYRSKNNPHQGRKCYSSRPFHCSSSWPFHIDRPPAANLEISTAGDPIDPANQPFSPPNTSRSCKIRLRVPCQP